MSSFVARPLMPDGAWARVCGQAGGAPLGRPRPPPALQVTLHRSCCVLMGTTWGVQLCPRQCHGRGGGQQRASNAPLLRGCPAPMQPTSGHCPHPGTWVTCFRAPRGLCRGSEHALTLQDVGVPEHQGERHWVCGAAGAKGQPVQRPAQLPVVWAVHLSCIQPSHSPPPGKPPGWGRSSWTKVSPSHRF